MVLRVRTIFTSPHNGFASPHNFRESAKDEFLTKKFEKAPDGISNLRTHPRACANTTKLHAPACGIIENVCVEFVVGRSPMEAERRAHENSGFVDDGAPR